MKIRELGQFGLIDRLAKMVRDSRDESAPAWQELIVGIGDDCAAWHGDTDIQLAHVDCQVEGTHFRREYGTWEELGWKAMAVITSDIAAMGGSPRYALISLNLRDDMDVASVTDLYKGMIQMAKETGIAIVGGHISGASLFSVTVTVTGSARGSILLRSAAKVGDRIAVTGDLGGAAAYVEMLENKLGFNPEAASSFKKAFLHPVPRIAEGHILVEEGIKACMDISDGILSDLKHICRASKVGARIDAGSVPVNPEVRDCYGRRALELAIGGGEDYELLFTGTPEAIEKVSARSTTPVTVIGEIVADHAGEVIVVDGSGKPLSLTMSGWDHFTRPANPDRQRFTEHD
ncbi:MAG: thiamine-phosphate kinase [Chloroflexota bacterium]